LIDPTPITGPDRPKAGMRFVTIDITMTNASTTTNHYHVYNTRLKTSDNREYDAAYAGPEPSFHYGDLAPGESVRAYLTFEILASGQPAWFIYTPDKGDRVVVPVR
jgi:hypothetical protein